MMPIEWHSNTSIAPYTWNVVRYRDSTTANTHNQLSPGILNAMNLVESDEDDVDDDGDHDAQRSSDKLVSITPGLIRALDLVDDDDVDSNDGDDAVVVPQQQHNLVQITPGLIRELSLLDLAPHKDDDDKEEISDEAAACCTRSPSPLSFTTDHNNSSAYETSIDEGCGLVSAVDVLRALRDQYANMTDDDNDSATTITTTTAATPPLFPSPPHHCSNQSEDLLFDNKENDTKIMENMHNNRAVTSHSCPPHLAKTRPLRDLQVQGACRRSLFDDNDDGDHDAQRSSDKLVSITPGLIRALNLVDDDDVDSNDDDDAVVVPQQHNLVQITPGLKCALNLAPDDDDDDKEKTTDEAAACCTRSPSPLSFTTDHNNSSAYETSIDEASIDMDICGLVSAVDVLRALRDQYANMTDDDNDSATTITTTTAATPPLFPSPPHHSSNHQDLFSIISSLENLLFDNKENDMKMMENTHSDDRAVTSLSCPPHLAKTRPLRVLQVEGAYHRSLFDDDDDEDSGGGTTITTPKDSVRYLSRIGKHHKPPLPPPSSSTFSSFNNR
ncbi:protein WAVE [Pseudoscourfieldia marina]